MGSMTMTDLYREVTGDQKAHQRAIDARVKKLDKRRQQILKRRVAGDTLTKLAGHYQVTRASIASVIRKALLSVRKDIAGEPRYNRIGRGGKLLPQK
jgi:DNA-directed RNA polymerase sigma subunit (sigma70/sigma32)